MALEMVPLQSGQRLDGPTIGRRDVRHSPCVPTRLLVGILVVWLAAGRSPHAVQSGSRAGDPPRVLNVVHQKLERRKAGAYVALETSIARAYARARVQVFWIALQSPIDGTDILYLHPADSMSDWDQRAGRIRQALAAHPDIEQLQKRLQSLVSRDALSTLTTKRDEVEPLGLDSSFATMRALRLTVFQVKPGQEGEFINSARIEGGGGRWLLYEANAVPTFMLVSPARSLTAARRIEIPRGLKGLRRAYAAVETQLYAVSPAMSHVPDPFLAAAPFWRSRDGPP